MTQIHKNKDLLENLNRLVVGSNFRRVLSSIAAQSYFTPLKRFFDNPTPLTPNSREFFLLIAMWINNYKVNHDYDTITEVECIQNVVLQSLQQIHKNLYPKELLNLSKKDIANGVITADALKETILYSGEGCIELQPLKYCEKKYTNDYNWIRQNKGFEVTLLKPFYIDLSKFIVVNISIAIEELISNRSIETFLDKLFVVDTEPLFALNSQYSQICNSFCVDISKGTGINICDFSGYNPLTATPIIKLDEKHIYVPYIAQLAIAMYDTPYYWMHDDDKPYYIKQGKENRGDFCESETVALLEKVFPSTCIHRNVMISKKKGSTITDIDVLVIYGDTAIIIQNKSKRLTAKAIKGTIDDVLSDFNVGIKEAHEQAKKAVNSVFDPEIKCKGKGSNTLLNVSCIEKFLTIGVSVDYFQAADMICKSQYGVDDDTFMVLSIFDLDILVSFINTPDSFIDYFTKRIKYRKKLFADNESSFLGLYLRTRFEEEIFDDLSDGIVYTINKQNTSNIEAEYRKLLVDDMASSQ